ncbi:MAG: hypothetical protein JXL97_11880 [Bacteroidales bacterium]|nr:hypothetical protein [Bacteroidales bacterium]
MVKLLKIELLKIKSYPVFWITFGLTVIIFVVVAIKGATLDFKFGFFSNNADLDSSNYFKFPYVWGTFSWIAGWFSHLWALLIIILLGNEFNFRMLRQQQVYGLSRKDLLVSKTLLIFGLPLIIFIGVVIFSISFGLKYSESATFSMIFEKSFYSLTYYLQSITYMTFAMLIVFLVGSTGLSLIVYLGYLFFEAIFRFILKQADLGGLNFFLPLKSVSSLTPRPSAEIALSENMQQQIQLNDNTLHFPILITILIGLFYFGLFWFLSYLIIKKKDL